jgi:hypothetical protein
MKSSFEGDEKQKHVNDLRFRGFTEVNLKFCGNLVGKLSENTFLVALCWNQSLKISESHQKYTLKLPNFHEAIEIRFTLLNTTFPLILLTRVQTLPKFSTFTPLDQPPLTVFAFQPLDTTHKPLLHQICNSYSPAVPQSIGNFVGEFVIVSIHRLFVKTASFMLFFDLDTYRTELAVSADPGHQTHFFVLICETIVFDFTIISAFPPRNEGENFHFCLPFLREK